MRTRITAGLTAILIGCTVPNTTSQPPATPELRYSVTDNEVTEHSLQTVINATYRMMNKVTYQNDKGNNTDIYLSGSCLAYKLNTTHTIYLTARHVPEGMPRTIMRRTRTGITQLQYFSNEVSIIDDSGIKQVLTTIMQDSVHDIAIMQSSHADVNTFNRLAPPNTVRVGNIVYGVGYPFGRMKTLSKGIISNLDDPTHIFLDAHINPGNSGGPFIVLSHGTPYLLGLASIKITNGDGIGGITRPEHLRSLLEGIE